MDGHSKLFAFLRGEGPGPRGATLEDVLSWNHSQLERQHDYIQWLFPTDEGSRFNQEVPLLTQDLAQVARQDERILANIRGALHVFLDFLGLRFIQAEPPRVHKEAFETRKAVCWSVTCAEGNHNWRRVSRVLRCLTLLGMSSEAKALYDCLEWLYVRGDLPADAAKSLQRWRLVAGCGAAPAPERVGILGRAMALLEDCQHLWCGPTSMDPAKSDWEECMEEHS